MLRAIAVVAGAAVCLAIAGCSSSSEPAKENAASSAPKKEQAPDLFRANMETTKGSIVIEVHRDWAPIGADQFYTLVKAGFYDGDGFFRVVRNFVVQFGINGDPKTNMFWSNVSLPDDPVKESNAKGTITFATAGPNTRTTQLFINLRDNSSLDQRGFAPFGKVVSGMDTVESLYSGYGDMPPQGEGPDPQMIERQGNEYLKAHFPRLDYVKKVTIQ